MIKGKLFIPLIIIAVPLILIVLFLIFVTILEYRPKQIEKILIKEGAKKETLNTSESFKIFNWNIGYCGLDAQNDFFYDGGKNVTARSKEAVLDNLKKVKEIIDDESCSFTLIQEIDIKSKRSFYIDEKQNLIEAFTNTDSAFASNYKAIIVPAPISNPLGQVHSGIFTLSNYKIKKAERRQLPGTFSWPLKTVNLKRCLLITEIKTDIENKSLYIINLHLSAYDSNGIMRKQEMEELKNIALQLYNSGNWVIAGGDWNSLFPGIEKDYFKPYTTPENLLDWIQFSPKNFINREWKWGFDKKTPTVRLLEKPYVAGENYTTIIDGFICSPNIEIIDIKTRNLNFTVSDHHPVIGEFKLRK